MNKLSTCLRKKRYSTRRYAKRANKENRRKGILGLNEYQCEHCSGWHLGNPPPEMVWNKMIKLRLFTSLISNRDQLRKTVPDVLIYNDQGGSFDVIGEEQRSIEVITWALEHGVTYQELPKETQIY